MPKYVMMVFLSVIFVMTGCTVSSAPLQFDDEIVDEEETDTAEDIETIIPLEEAIKNTQSDLVKSFWFRAHIANNIEKRKNTHMTLNGIVIKPHGYYMRNTLVTQPYEYYRYDDQVYIRQNGNWFRGREPELPFDIFYGFDQWEPMLDRAEVTRADDVLGIPTVVWEMELSGSEFYELDSLFVDNLPLNEADPLANILENTNVRVLFYIGDVTKSTDDREVLPIIYKYQTWIQMPIPDAGYMEQEIQHFIFRVNSDNTEMPSVEEVEHYLIEINDAQKMMELEEEEKEEKNKD